MEDIFLKFGRVSRLDIKSGASFNFAFIEFEDKRDAEDALRETDGTTLFGAKIVVEWSKGGSRRSERGDRDSNGERRPSRNTGGWERQREGRERKGEAMQ